MRLFLIVSSFFLLFCVKKATTHKKVQFQVMSLNSYPYWPQKLCDNVVDSAMINSLERSGLLAIKIINNAYNLVMIDLAAELLCDSLHLYTPNVKLIFMKEDDPDSLSNVVYLTHLGGGRIDLPKDSSKIVLVDCKPDEQIINKVEFLYTYRVDSSNAYISKEFKIVKYRNNAVVLDY